MVRAEICGYKRVRIALRIGAIVAAIPVFAGCANVRSFMTSRQTVAMETGGGAPAAVPNQNIPYVCDAQWNGQFINFCVCNPTGVEVPVQQQQFALIQHGTRQVVPYLPGNNDVIEIPDPGTVPPGGKIQCRAIFRAVQDPCSSRLVFKPDTGPTFTVIQDGRRFGGRDQ